MAVGDLDEDLTQEKLVEDVAAKHVEEFAFGMAAAKFEPLADHMETAGISSGQGLTEDKHGVASVERIESGALVVTIDRKSTRLNSSHRSLSRMPSSA